MVIDDSIKEIQYQKTDILGIYLEVIWNKFVQIRTTMSVRKEMKEMWLESVNKKISEKGITIKQIAAESYLSEKTVKRILTGASKSPSMANVIAIVQCVGCSLDEVFEIFVGTQAVLGDENLVKLQQECETYKEQLSNANQEILDLKQKCTELEIDLRIAKKEIELKDQIIAVHDYYTKKS